MKFVFITLILFLIINPKDVAALTRCEGFIKSNTEIDYSKIQAKLFTAQGNLKHEAECNPGNGSFFIPIGKYLIKLSTPEGWIFVPELHEVNIDNDGECPGELNFELAGFQIKGAIQNDQNSHLELGLYQENNNELIANSTIHGNGEYNFTAKPGKYVISPISGSSSEHCVDQGRINVEIVNAPIHVKPDIRVAGHNLKVQLNDEKGNPLPSATAILVAEEEIKFKNLPPPMASNRAQKWFYSLKTDSTGSVMFYCIPPGKYSISGELRRQRMEAHFEEKQIEINSKAAKEVEISMMTSFTADCVSDCCTVTAIAACLWGIWHFYFSIQIILAWFSLSLVIIIFYFNGTVTYKHLRKNPEVLGQIVDKSKIASVIQKCKFILCVFVWPPVFLVDFMSELFAGKSSILDQIKLTIILTIHDGLIDIEKLNSDEAPSQSKATQPAGIKNIFKYVDLGGCTCVII